MLYTYDVGAPERQLQEAVARLEAINRDLNAQLPKTKAVGEARARYVQAEARVTAAQTNLEKERVRDGDQLIEAEDALNWSLQEVTDARESLDAMVPQDRQAALLAQRSEVQQLEMELLDNEVKAPLAGAITMLAVQPGAEVVKGLAVVQIDDSRKLKAVALVDSRDLRGLAPGQPVLLRSNGRATNTTVTSTSGRTVEILVDNPALMFEPGEAEVQIHGNPVPLIR